MRTVIFRSSLLGSTALVGALTVLAAPAQAQMYSTGPGVYLSVEGRYMWNIGNAKVPDYLYAYNVGYDTARSNAEKGFGGKAMLGFRFGNAWDVGLGVGGGRLKGTDAATFGYNSNPTPPVQPAVRSDRIETKLTYVAVDFEAGYTMAMGQNSNLRLFGGLRAADFNQKAKGSSTVSPATIAFAYEGSRKTKFFGVGPRIGANGSFGIGNSGFNLFGGISGALLFGRYSDKHSFVDSRLPRFLPQTYSYTNEKKTKLVPNVEGELGLGYNFKTSGGSTVGLQVGYKADAWFGTGSRRALFAHSDNLNEGSPFKDKAGDDIFHGPFVRLVATFGSAAPMPMASAPPPAQPPMMVKSFIVFFDFDKSNITAEAQKTINDAVAAAKAGGSSRVTLTGHTDRSGSEQYNMALSLRRAEAVKANMIRQGIPASAIVVIGKGESSPLVPTADGVREPQNRRVEIVI